MSRPFPQRRIVLRKPMLQAAFVWCQKRAKCLDVVSPDDSTSDLVNFDLKDVDATWKFENTIRLKSVLAHMIPTRSVENPEPCKRCQSSHYCLFGSCHSILALSYDGRWWRLGMCTNCLFTGATCCYDSSRPLFDMEHIKHLASSLLPGSIPLRPIIIDDEDEVVVLSTLVVLDDDEDDDGDDDDDVVEVPRLTLRLLAPPATPNVSANSNASPQLQIPLTPTPHSSTA